MSRMTGTRDGFVYLRKVTNMEDSEGSEDLEKSWDQL
jgi:hypothetical protein